MAILAWLPKLISEMVEQICRFAWNCYSDFSPCRKLFLALERKIHLRHSCYRKAPAVRFFTIAIATSFGFIQPFSAESQTVSAEYKLKAAFLYNFVQFVDWPESAFASDESPLVIGVLGTDPFGSALEEIVEGETVRGRKLTVRRFKTVKEVENCHMLFISASERANLDTTLASLKGRSILTVGDTEGFAVNGGMVRFVTENNKIRFKINLEAVRAEKLSISSKLLQLADIVPVENSPK